MFIKNVLLDIPPSVRLVAVTKGRSAQDIEKLIINGHTWFGENRIHDILKKWPSLKARYPHIKLQFIGQLQSNKVLDAVISCDSIISIDRPSLVQSIAKALKEHPKTIELLVQVNIAKEAQKGGVMEEELDAFLTLCNDYNLSITGLMTIPPVDLDPSPYFKRLKDLCNHYNLPGCSMGMSADYKTAIALGATQVRVGRALFEEDQ